jgi:hypothetical protein
MAKQCKHVILNACKAPLHTYNTILFHFCGENWHCERVSSAGLPDFFLTQYTKRGKIYEIATKLPNDHKMYQIDVISNGIKYTNTFLSKALQNFPKLRFLV